MKTYAHPEYLISTDALAAKIATNDQGLLIFDATVSLVPADKGYKAISGLADYHKGHIPTANFMDLMVDLADTTSGFGFTMPTADQLQQSYRQLGINDDSEIVIYSSGHMMWATRAWWMLHSCGHKNVSVLDGGIAKWLSENRAVATDNNEVEQGDFTVDLNNSVWADKSQVLAAIDDGDICTINALAPDVYSGYAKMSYGRKGHITGSQNIFYDEVLQDGCFRNAEQLTEVFSRQGVLQKPKVIAYCGGGISATIDALALKLIGHEDIAVYDGSMSEWVADEKLPMSQGPGA
ncbi:MAG: sulfurtransferase [Pseudomonadales bacterium]|nr:sulfurtransferase [Pseudomonadales bacterium]MDG1443467.1 sulfurtransferase [Pseudomonadales bacterium]